MGYIKLIFISMIPIVELRGAIPIGIAMNLDPLYVYLACVFGSTIISIPIVILFKKIIEYLRHKKYFNKLIVAIDKKIEGRAKKLKKASIIGLILFVGVPLPTTGSWSAAALGSILNMRIRDAVFGIFIGNALAGVIMTLIGLNLAKSNSIYEIVGIAVVLLIAVAFYIVHKRKKRAKENVMFKDIKE